MKPNIHMWQIEVIPWRPDLNTKEVIKVIANTPEWDLTVFWEEIISWYMIWDMWLRDSFIKECAGYNERILEALKKYWNSAIWWNIDYDEKKKNQDWSIRKYNTAYVWEKWVLLWKRYKTLLPNYRMFDDKRYFTSLIDLALEERIPLEEYYKPFLIEIGWVRQRVWVLICEDIWNINWDYSVDPVAMTKKHWIDILAIPSCSPFGLDKDLFRKKLLKMHSDWIKLIYVNPIWTQNNWKNIFTFDGWSAIYENWNFISWVKDFTTNEITNILDHKSQITQIFTTLVYSIKNFCEKIWWKKVIIWLSWWIDSAVVASLLVIAIWKENVLAVNMPSKFNSSTTKKLAKALAWNLWIEYKIFPIQKAINAKVKQMTQVTWKVPEEFEIENIQARERWQILSDLAATYGALFTNNWNKDEVTTGYATLYWDVSWAFSPLWDLYKNQVYDLARYINKFFWKETIPNYMIEKLKAAAELSSKQNPDLGGWDPFNYEFLGKLNRWFIERKYTPVDMLKFYKDWTLEKKLWLELKINELFKSDLEFINEIEKIWKLLHKSYFKRVQAPPIMTISKWSFWFDYREAQMSEYFWEEYEKVKNEILER